MKKKATIHILITVPFEQSMIDEIRTLSLNLNVTTHNAQRNEEVPEDVWAQTEVLYTDRALPKPSQVPNLRWIQFHRCEVGFIKDLPLIEKDDLLITTPSGAGASTIAEYIVMMMLALGHRLPEMINNQKNTRWPDIKEDKIIPGKELRDSIVGIIGYGSVGRELARQLQAFSTKVLAIKRDVRKPQDNGYFEPNLGDPEGDLFHRLYPIQALSSMIKECDYVICSLPDTNETQNLFTEEVFQSMRQGSYFIHIGGKKVINETALLNAVQHRLRGAAIDSFSTEPLPSENPLWHQPNVIISPHLAGLSTFYNKRAARLFIENLKNYLAGKSLINLFDKQLGY